MSPMRWSDILAELIELSRELISEIKQQLTYYRASVYKHETATHINERIVQLRTIAKLIPCDFFFEPFKDYDAISENGNIKTAPGECAFSSRVSRLLTSMATQLDDFEQRRPAEQASQDGREFKRTIEKHRQEILKMCRYGSRQWSFFKTL